MNFETMGLNEKLLEGLRKAGFSAPTPVQEKAIPKAMAGGDLIATAQTGTGKTAAFVLPLLHRLMQSRETKRTRALILTPTRELADQIGTVLEELGRYAGVRSTVIYGGVGYLPQSQALHKGVEIVVACPGRLLDHIEQGNARLKQVELLVLDEADRMLDMGFLPSIRRILGQLPRERQTMLFSATFGPAMEGLIRDALRQPERITVDNMVSAETVEHSLFPVAQNMKNQLLLELLKQTTAESVLIFTRTKYGADRVAEKINKSGKAAAALHANKSQNQRRDILARFKAGRTGVLVATDIAARGLDISSISHVINYDMPDCATTYIHRVGRTGRATRSGKAITLATLEDFQMVKDVEKILGRPIPRGTCDGFTDADLLPMQKPEDKTPMLLSRRRTVTHKRRL
jgi:ATP-dependent RNA helicase RhlE